MFIFTHTTTSNNNSSGPIINPEQSESSHAAVMPSATRSVDDVDHPGQAQVQPNEISPRSTKSDGKITPKQRTARNRSHRSAKTLKNTSEDNTTSKAALRCTGQYPPKCMGCGDATPHTSDGESDSSTIDEQELERLTKVINAYQDYAQDLIESTFGLKSLIRKFIWLLLFIFVAAIIFESISQPPPGKALILNEWMKETVVRHFTEKFRLEYFLGKRIVGYLKMVISPILSKDFLCIPYFAQRNL